MMRYFCLASILILSACAPKKAVERDNQLVQNLVKENQDEVRACYQEEAAKNPEIGEGKLVIRADHHPNGTLSHFWTKTRFSGSTPVEKCLFSLMETWQTEPPYTRGPVEISWTFRK